MTSIRCNTAGSLSRLTCLATARLLNFGPDTCKRVELEVVDAIKKADWNRARQLLHLRVRMRLAPTKDERATIDRILTSIDEAEAKGVGPNS
jgi:hypothetical protein